MSKRIDGSFETRDGCRIAYSLHPNPGSPRISLIHSLALDRQSWNRLVDLLHGQAEILTFDCRGHGKSSLAKGPYSSSLMAQDMSELLVHIGWDSTHLAGCSMGGCIAQAFAAEHSSQTQSLCLFDTTAWYGPDAPVQWRERARVARENGLPALLEFQSSRWFSEGFKTKNPSILREIEETFLANDIDCYQASCEMLGDTDLRKETRQIVLPAAIVVGADDYATPVAMARWLHEAIQNSTIEIIAHCKHLSPVERPDVAKEQLLKLVARANSEGNGEVPSA